MLVRNLRLVALAARMGLGKHKMNAVQPYAQQRQEQSGHRHQVECLAFVHARLLAKTLTLLFHQDRSHYKRSAL